MQTCQLQQLWWVTSIQKCCVIPKAFHPRTTLNEYQNGLSARLTIVGGYGRWGKVISYTQGLYEREKVMCTFLATKEECGPEPTTPSIRQPRSLQATASPSPTQTSVKFCCFCPSSHPHRASHSSRNLLIVPWRAACSHPAGMGTRKGMESTS